MVINATIITITVLISTLFISLTSQQILALSLVFLLVQFFCHLPKWITIFMIAFLLSSFQKSEQIYQANQVFKHGLEVNKQAWNKNASDHIITAEVITLVNRKNGFRFNARVNTVDNNQTNFIKPIIRLHWLQQEGAKIQVPELGQVWRFKIRIHESKNAAASEFYSYPHYLLSQQILYSGYVSQADLLSADTSLRQSYFNFIKQRLPEKANGLLLALSFGDRTSITESQWQLYQQFGISHLIAISGLHVGMLFGFCLLLLRSFGYLCKQQISLNACLIVSLIFAGCYVWLAGFSLPAMRALVLLTISCCYRMLGYKVTLLQIAIYMLLITLIIDPRGVYGVSFLLSFYAMACVFFLAWWLMKPKTSLTSPFHHYAGLISVAVKTQFLLFFLLIPVQLVVFSGFSWLSFLANLLLIPIFSFLLLPILLCAVLVAYAIPQFSQHTFVYLNFAFDLLDKTLITISSHAQPWIEFDIKADLNHATLFLLLLYFIILLSFTFKPIAKSLLILLALLGSSLPLSLYQFS